MPTEDVGLDVAHGDLELLGNEGAEPRGVEHARHPKNTLARELTDFVGQLCHCIERVADDDQNAGGRSLDELQSHAPHDVLVGLDQVVSRHARLAWNAGGDHADAGCSGFLVAIGSDDAGVVAHDRPGFQHVEGFSLWQTLDDVDQHDVRIATLREPLGQGRAHIAGAHHRDLGTSHPPATVANRPRSSLDSAEWRG